MPKLTRIAGLLTPTPSVLLTNATFRLPSFTATVDGASAVLTPSPEDDIDGREGVDRAHHEIGALLAVLGSEGSEPLGFKVMEVAEVDAEGQHYVTDCAFVKDFAEASIQPGPASLAKLSKKVEWAARDLVYRELLGLLLLARRAKNPRPLVYNMVERLEVKFGGWPSAARALGVPKSLVDRVNRDQSNYDGDRHAKHDVRAARAEVDSSLRNAVLDVAVQLVRAYETAVCPAA
jgi:hypothetical protein